MPLAAPKRRVQGLRQRRRQEEKERRLFKWRQQCAEDKAAAKTKLEELTPAESRRVRTAIGYVTQVR